MQIHDKVVVVTGGASGLGAACVRAFHAKGAHVAVFDLSEVAGRELASQLGERAIYARVDVADEESVVKGIAATRDAFGRIDVCVNCAGIPDPGKTFGRSGPLPLRSFARVIDVNLNGTFNVLRLAVAEMVRNEPDSNGERGVVINTASGAATDGQMGQAAYAASKAGVVGMTLPIARDLSSLGIRVNTLSPGLFETGMSAGLPENVKKRLVDQLEFPKRMGEAAEYAGLVMHVVENAYINAAVLRIDAAARPPAR